MPFFSVPTFLSSCFIPFPLIIITTIILSICSLSDIHIYLYCSFFNSQLIYITFESTKSSVKLITNNIINFAVYSQITYTHKLTNISMTQLPSVSELINRTGSIGSSSNITRVPPMTTTSTTNTTTAAAATTVTSTTPRSENSYSPNSPYSLPTRPSNTSLTNYSAGSGITVASSSFQFSQPSPGRSKHNSTSSQSSSGDSFQQHQSNPSGVSMSSNTSPRTSIVQSMSSVPTPPSTGPAPQQFVYQESQLPVQPPPQQQLQQPPPPPQQQQHIYPQQQPNFPYHNNFVSPPTYTTAYPQYYYQPVMTPPHHQHHHQPHQQAPIHLANNVSILQSQAVMQNAYPTTHYLQHVGPHHIYANVNSQVYYQDMAREEANKALINKRRIIKRRTRTGCLTCRKRRIKCDERKPTCFNCERSKNHVLGIKIY